MSGSRAALPAASLARVVVFTAFLAVLGLFPGIGGVAGVPVVVQNGGPILVGAILGWRLGTASVALLLALTALGLPLLHAMRAERDLAGAMERGRVPGSGRGPLATAARAVRDRLTAADQGALGAAS